MFPLEKSDVSFIFSLCTLLALQTATVEETVNRVEVEGVETSSEQRRSVKVNQYPRQFHLQRTEQDYRLHAVLRGKQQDDSPSPAAGIGGTGSSAALAPVPQPSPATAEQHLLHRAAAPVRGAPAPRVAGAAF